MFIFRFIARGSLFIGIAFLAAACNAKNHSVQDTDVFVQVLASPADSSSAQPFLFAADGAYLSWVEKKDSGHILKFSVFDGSFWSESRTIAEGDDWFVNWADYPMLATNGANDMLAFFLQKSAPDTYAYDIREVVSADAGDTWSASRLLHDDGVKAEHGFVSVSPVHDGFFVSWLDGRNTVSDSPDGHDGHHGHGGSDAMTLRAAMLDRDGNKSAEWELDTRVCDCCQTGVAITDNGPVVVYRDRSDDEVRDIHIVRLVDGEWTAPKPVFADAWRIEGCPVNGPRVAASGNTVAVAWFTAPDGDTQVNVAFSMDGGATFAKPIRLPGESPLGRLGLAMLDEQRAAVSWLLDGRIEVAQVGAEGLLSDPVTIAETANVRASGFPQMVRVAGQLLFAWTDAEEKMVKTALLDIGGW